MAETFETRFWHAWFALVNGFSLIIATGMIAVGFPWWVLVAMLVSANLLLVAGRLSRAPLPLLMIAFPVVCLALSPLLSATFAPVLDSYRRSHSPVTWQLVVVMAVEMVVVAGVVFYLFLRRTPGPKP
jgi:hypothetical protein